QAPAGTATVLLTAVRASTSRAMITTARVNVSHCESFTRVSFRYRPTSGDVGSLPRDRNRTISTRAIGISIERNCVSGSKDAAIATAAPPTGPDVFPFGAARQSTGVPRGG